MTFSPYSLNGHQFRGFGFDLSPKGSWRLSAMLGRLSKAVEQHSEVNNVLPSYKKMGYGVKLNFEKAKYMLGLNLFQAKDNLNSFPKSLDSLMISPQENLVIGAEVRIRPLKGLELSSELATSALTRDSRDSTPKPRHTNFLGWLSKANHTTSFYTAFKMQMNYT